MQIAKKIKNILRGLRQIWGTSQSKQRLWNKEFAEGRWDFIENTADDIVYPIIEKYSRSGSILDLGCGSGNTSCELKENCYREYTGVDISDVALEKAKLRSENCQRSNKNQYQASDICEYVPNSRFDVILFRESIYYIPKWRIRAILGRYAGYLKDDGVLIIRWHDATECDGLVNLLGANFEIIERSSPDASGPIVLVIRPIP